MPQAWQACNSMWRLWKCPTLSQDCKRTLFRATVGTVLPYNAETWTTTRALERRIDGVYTRLLRKALDVPWQLQGAVWNDTIHYGPVMPTAPIICWPDVKISLSNIWSSGRAKLAKCAVDKATASHTSNNCCVMLAAQLSTNFNRR